ncbi:hypothetical protein [Campylobacter sp. US33a]|uniref:hypothetical protein n=1 Tax=Campylobacter sp. US33a TaxID=2498120 RepID=UPI0010683930|nr:hypothetical protein [Campylobacter sp. US33a]TEY00504.1 hypothetical protein ELQ16_09145 [Campylobacter sp. US33a]
MMIFQCKICGKNIQTPIGKMIYISTSCACCISCWKNSNFLSSQVLFFQTLEKIDELYYVELAILHPFWHINLLSQTPDFSHFNIWKKSFSSILTYLKEKIVIIEYANEQTRFKAKFNNYIQYANYEQLKSEIEKTMSHVLGPIDIELVSKNIDNHILNLSNFANIYQYNLGILLYQYLQITEEAKEENNSFIRTINNKEYNHYEKIATIFAVVYGLIDQNAQALLEHLGHTVGV